MLMGGRDMTLDEMKRMKQECGISLAQLSVNSNVPLGTLQKIFSGETENPRYATRQAIEKALINCRRELFPVESKSVTYSFNREPQRVEESFRYNALISALASKKQGEYTLEDYYALPDDRRVELIDGVIYDMSAPAFVHQHILGNMYIAINDYIRSKGGECLPMLAPVDVCLDCDDKTMVQPDILILCDKSKICKWGIMGAPDFCLEIVSESTRRKDYIKKPQKYIDAGVKEYWIIDPMRKMLITYCWKDEYIPHLYLLEGKVGFALYDEELQIDLGDIAALIHDYPS